MTQTVRHSAGWTIPEAVRNLVDEVALKPYLGIKKRVETFEREALEKYGPSGPPYIIGPNGFEPYHPLTSDPFFGLQDEKRRAEMPVRRQFLDRLQECQVFARKGEPTAELTRIPKTALPLFDKTNEDRLSLSSIDETLMEFGHGASMIKFFDVRIWPSGELVNPEALAFSKPRTGRPPNTGFDDSAPLRAMKKLVNKGMNITPAAQQVVRANRPAVQGGGTEESKVRRLVRKFPSEFG